MSSTANTPNATSAKVALPRAVVASRIWVNDFTQRDEGLSTILLDMVSQSQQLYYCEGIEFQVRKALGEHGIPESLIQLHLRSIDERATFVQPRDLPSFVRLPVPELKLLATAHSAGAQVLYTGNPELNKLGKYRNIQIIHPEQMGIEPCEILAEDKKLSDLVGSRKEVFLQFTCPSRYVRGSGRPNFASL